ncbi:MAG: inner-membrane translocator [Thermomicrobiales bacterium]|nr:inner-membrane translocator [Thermomicrobiales bacterium]
MAIVAAPTQQTGRRAALARVGPFLSTYGVAIAFLLLVAFFAYMTQGTFTSRANLTNLSRQATMIGIIAVGMTVVMIGGGIDLSVGGIVGAVGVVTALLMVDRGWAMWPAIGAGLLLGAALGLWNGVFVARFDIAPFIVTLGMMSIARGVALVLSAGASIVPSDPAFAALAAGAIPPGVSVGIILVGGALAAGMAVRRGRRARANTGAAAMAIRVAVILLAAGAALYVFAPGGIPTPVAIWATVAVAGVFLLNRTRFGRNVYAIGGNEEAAWLSAIDVNAVKLTIYTLSGLLAGLSAIILTSRQAAAVPQQGTLYELDAIAAVVIGGTGLNGGYGTVVGSLLGVAIVASANNGLSLMNIDPLWQYVVKGLIITFAVLLDRRRR